MLGYTLVRKCHDLALKAKRKGRHGIESHDLDTHIHNFLKMEYSEAT